ncbi:hypothetical protein QE152_g38524 [Popillia japonica]|uniref:Uncharacterized protein n=1 Tax=Popillia japonica TaxID=7064 RepID=A0AAW1HXV7_POPJA
MDKLKPKYNLSNPNVQELIDLLQAGDLSDIEVGTELGEGLILYQQWNLVQTTIGPDTVSTMEFGPDDNQKPEESNDDNNDELNTKDKRTSYGIA